jgi:hypothetical protein
MGRLRAALLGPRSARADEQMKSGDHPEETEMENRA